MLRHIKPGMLVFSVLYILLGLLLLLAPQAVADVFCIALGLLVVLCGLQSLYGYFKKDNGSIRAAVSLLLSLPTIALGMWALLCTVQSAMTFEWLLPLLFGLMLLVDGVVRAQSSFALAKRKGQKWWVVLLLSIVSLLCGALLACSQLLNNRNVDLLLLETDFSPAAEDTRTFPPAATSPSRCGAGCRSARCIWPARTAAWKSCPRWTRRWSWL